jgi:hypothetical protein
MWESIKKIDDYENISEMMVRFLNVIFVSDPSRLNVEQGAGDRSWIFVERVSKEE